MKPIYWIISLLLLLAPIVAPAEQHTVLVKAQTLSLRDKAKTTGEVITKLSTYQPVEFLKKDGDWAQVKTPQGQTGYVLAEYLSNNAFVYADAESVNGRYGPDTKYDVIITYTQNMPLRVLDLSDGWLMVMDYEGDRCWVTTKSIKVNGRYVINKEENANVRKGVGIGQDKAFTAQKGCIFQVLEEKDGWLHVKYTADGSDGWMSAKLVYGWYDVPPPAPKGDSAKKTTDKDAAAGDKSDNANGKSTKAGKSGKKASTSDDSSDSGSGKSKSGSRTKSAKKASSSDDDPPARKTTRKTKARAKSDE